MADFSKQLRFEEDLDATSLYSPGTGDYEMEESIGRGFLQPPGSPGIGFILRET